MNRLLPETLANDTDARIAAALANGALCPIETEELCVEEGGVRFLVRAVSTLAKRRSRRVTDGAAPGNPFLPWDPKLFVAELSATHVALLNKFPVLDRHLLIVTRRFVRQEMLLDVSDFDAASRCLDGVDGLVFYNGGREAGASQPHKHLQLVPLPLSNTGPRLPVEPLIADAKLDGDGVGRVPGFAFPHACCLLRRPTPGELAARFRELLKRTGLDGSSARADEQQSGPYNLLFTRAWMLLVPRRCECFRGISVNALGYAGSLFVRHPAEIETVRELGPLTLLRRVSLLGG